MSTPTVHHCTDPLSCTLCREDSAEREEISTKIRALPGAGEATTEPEDTIRMVERVVRACSSGTHREFGAAYDALLTRLRATAAALTRSEAAREQAEQRREEADIRADSLLHLPAALAREQEEPLTHLIAARAVIQRMFDFGLLRENDALTAELLEELYAARTALGRKP